MQRNVSPMPRSTSPPSSNTTSQALLRAASSPANPGYRNAWGIIVNRHHPYVVSVARTLLRSRRDVDALDVAQEVFARACVGLGRFVPVDPTDIDACLRGWLATITRRYVIDELRRAPASWRREDRDVLGDVADATRSAERAMFYREVTEHLLREVKRCTRGEERMVYYCFFVEELSFAEIITRAKEIYDIKLEEPALRQRIARFRQRLHRELAT